MHIPRHGIAIPRLRTHIPCHRTEISSMTIYFWTAYLWIVVDEDDTIHCNIYVTLKKTYTLARYCNHLLVALTKTIGVDNLHRLCTQ